MAKQAVKVLTKTRVRRFKVILEEKAQETRNNLGSLKAANMLARGQDPVALEDLPVQSHEEWIFLNRNNIDVMLLREIEDALTRIDGGGYGTCSECDEPISSMRLRALPWARYCVPCQEELSDDPEEKSKQSHLYSL